LTRRPCHEADSQHKRVSLEVAEAYITSRSANHLPRGPGGGERLQKLLTSAAEQLTLSGKDERLYAALKLTYLDAARTQEEAAELLGMAFSSYRRYLRAAIERVVEWLWQRELHGR
jgi:hypothetical protein